MKPEQPRADEPICSWCTRGKHDICKLGNRRPCPCNCREPSFLNHYGLGNVVTTWLIAKAPELVAAGPTALYSHDRPPRCPFGDCGQSMKLRPGFWKCFMHDPPITLRVRPEYERAPEGDVLAMLRRATG